MPHKAPLDLIRPDGSVIVPAAVARDVVRLLVAGLTARVRADGGEVSTQARRVLFALHNAARQAERAASGPSSDTRTTTPAWANVEIATGEAAALLGCSSEYVRRLARRGDIRARRIGTAWLIDRADLDRYRHNPQEAGHAAQPQPP